MGVRTVSTARGAVASRDTSTVTAPATATVTSVTPSPKSQSRWTSSPLPAGPERLHPLQQHVQFGFEITSSSGGLDFAANDLTVSSG